MIWPGPALGGADEREDPRVLVIDDEPAVVDTVRRTLSVAGIRLVVVETDPTRVLTLHDPRDFDAILLDLHMPVLGGFELMGEMVSRIGDDEYAPILVMTGDERVDVRRRALASGAKDFVQKPFEPTEVAARVRNIIETRRLQLRLRAFNGTLASRVRERTQEAVEAKLEVLHRLARAGEYRDDLTGLHAARVGTLSGMLAREIGLDEEVALEIERAAPLHDIGKIGIPDAILLKKGGLNPAEVEVMRQHTVIGAGILAGSRFDLLRTAERIALSHHEHWDGRGYPHGSLGIQIPEEGLIVAVADAFDSLTNDRPYRPGCAHGVAVAEIARHRARQFAPHIVDALLRLFRAGRLEEIERQTMDSRSGR